VQLIDSNRLASKNEGFCGVHATRAAHSGDHRSQHGAAIVRMGKQYNHATPGAVRSGDAVALQKLGAIHKTGGEKCKS